MSEAVRDFFEGYEDATIGARVPDATYHVSVVANLGAPDWSKPATPVVQLETEVASGEFAGMRLPRVNLQLGGFSYKVKKGPHTGELREVPEERVYKDLQGTVRAIHGETPPAIGNTLSGPALLEALADALVGDEFIATVRTNPETGYQDLRNIRSMDDPPKGFVLAAELEEFRV